MHLVDSIALLSERQDVSSRKLVDGLLTIAERAPDAARTVVPVHADCHWGNWLVNQDHVSALLDFEWARFGEPVDDWMFLARFSGPYVQDVLAVIAELTGTDLKSIRTSCELREVSYLTSDLVAAIVGDEPEEAHQIVELLDQTVARRLWWDDREPH